MKRFLLDTNMLLEFTRKAQWAEWAYEEFGLGAADNIVFTSAICRGEILAITEKFGWVPKKRTELVRVLNQFTALDINKDSILEAYAAIDVWTHGKPVTDPRFPTPLKPAISMKQNDLWIAATAIASNATLLTTDKDFDHLDGVCLSRVWVDQANKPKP